MLTVANTMQFVWTLIIVECEIMIRIETETETTLKGVKGVICLVAPNPNGRRAYTHINFTSLLLKSKLLSHLYFWQLYCSILFEVHKILNFLKFQIET